MKQQQVLIEPNIGVEDEDEAMRYGFRMENMLKMICSHNNCCITNQV